MNKQVPDLDNLISALECENWRPSICEICPYNYQYLDDTGDNSPFWACDENKKLNDALFYLKLYKYLIKEKNNE